MSFDVPSDRRYLESHEWAERAGDRVRVGITDFAQDELGDVVFVEFPPVGTEVAANDPFGVIESIKAVSDLYAPVSGTVTAVNDTLSAQPELVNDDPYAAGWMIEIEVTNAIDAEWDALLDATEYGDQIA